MFLDLAVLVQSVVGLVLPTLYRRAKLQQWYAQTQMLKYVPACRASSICASKLGSWIGLPDNSFNNHRFLITQCWIQISLLVSKILNIT